LISEFSELLVLQCSELFALGNSGLRIALAAS
jgi:hypothetical protein